METAAALASAQRVSGKLQERLCAITVRSRRTVLATQVLCKWKSHTASKKGNRLLAVCLQQSNLRRELWRAFEKWHIWIVQRQRTAEQRSLENKLSTELMRLQNDHQTELRILRLENQAPLTSVHTWCTAVWWCVD